MECMSDVGIGWFREALVDLNKYLSKFSNGVPNEEEQKQIKIRTTTLSFAYGEEYMMRGHRVNEVQELAAQKSLQRAINTQPPKSIYRKIAVEHLYYVCFPDDPNGFRERPLIKN